MFREFSTAGQGHNLALTVLSVPYSLDSGPSLREILAPGEVFFITLTPRVEFRGGLVSKAHRLCVSLNSRLESNKEEEEGFAGEAREGGARRRRTEPREC